jgi:hypothetical protein
MKRNLLLAISVLALTAASQPLFAAESDTPAPRERAAPASARQARPAPVRQAPQRAAPASQTSSFTGSQAGGFGGGNSGGGGFADPICSTQFTGVTSGGCAGSGFSHSLNKTGGTGGGVFEYKWAVSPWVVVGVMADLGFGKTSASSSQSVTYSTSPPDLFGQVTTQNTTNSVSQSTNGSIRAKVGIVTQLPGFYSAIMPYLTAGVVRSKFEVNFAQTSSNYSSLFPSCSFNPSCSQIVTASSNTSKTVNGFVGGGGVEFVLFQGFVLGFDYSHARFSSFDVDLNANVVTINNLPCVASSLRSCAAVDKGHVDKPTSNKFLVTGKFALPGL